MSVSWNYLTKSAITLRYRDTIAGIIIGGFLYSKVIDRYSKQSDNDFVMTRVYNNDESDIEFREEYNKTDSAVRREKILSFAAKIKEERAKMERAMMLEAYNKRNGKAHETSVFQ